jgi:L-ascorbate metabolism protein UlaG (beta-lactamase superfamily)
MPWGDSQLLGAVKIISTPARHYSGRDLFDYKKTFWSSWSIVGPTHRFYYSGDSGYSDHFKTIGERYGPFDLTIIKVGAYGPGNSWLDIHMSPEHAVQAHNELRGMRMLPVHWATFNMGFHDWDEPIKRTLRAAALSGAQVITPRVGESVTIGEDFVSQRWWTPVGQPQL